MTEQEYQAKKQPKQARAKARVEKILTCSENLLIKKGSEAISTTSIAKTAGIPVGSIYQYFEGKDDILLQLYDGAYNDIESSMSAALEKTNLDRPFSEIISDILHAFWKAAQLHPSFKLLTRWANSKRSLWETTPSSDSSLGQLIKKTLLASGARIPSKKETVVLTTTVTIVSVMIDLAIEEKDEEKASSILEELVIVLSKYLG